MRWVLRWKTFKPCFCFCDVGENADANQQLNRIIEFRQAISRDAFRRERDAQFELLDALTSHGSHIRSFPELSLSPFFRRQWSSVYAAVERGTQDRAWLTKYLSQQLEPHDDQVVVMALDMSAWPRPDAETLPDRQFVRSATQDATGEDVVIGQPYSILAWVADPEGSWALPVRVARVSSDQTEVEAGVAQVRAFCEARGAEALTQRLHVIVADGRYGNHRFFGPLRDRACGLLARMRCDRVLYQLPQPRVHPGPGRPRKHGDRFAFKEPETWPEPDQHLRFSDEEEGEVEIRYWTQLHAREDADTPFAVLRVQTHLERETLPDPEWLGWQGPNDYAADRLWSWYQQRPTIEQSIRWRKQLLQWTTPEFHSLEVANNWTTLVTLAQWQLYMARDCVPDQPLPWQQPQRQLTPRRVQQGIWVLLLKIGTPAAPPKTRGNSPGWPGGQPRQRRQRYTVVRKGDP
jgi:hypothetical protein